ncbi:CPBP family intramembrane glutamic endopeptidase [Ligilactobacillus cholophilus]|uniref:CPBP family intramembrane glutamic endopeptidase n=1 Tax=Ligilactobacillus cholophilus TaxID=3050131 RepID=UPI0025B08730|nr:CPBP family intramembrane glutamic endopeptidase [Ligilactobacillus cholophilus]
MKRINGFTCRSLFIVIFIIEQIGFNLFILKHTLISLILMVISLIGALLLQLWYQKIRNQKLDSLKKNFKFILIALICLMITVLIISVILNIAHVPLPEDQQVIKSVGNNIFRKIEILFFIVIVAPVVEEGLFRTGIIGKSNHTVLLSLLSTFLIILGHLDAVNVSEVTLIFYSIQFGILGLTFCVLYCCTKDWRINTITHIIWNFISFLDLLF